jgi:hypothetical protein
VTQFAFSFDSEDAAEVARSVLLGQQHEADVQPQDDGRVVLVVSADVTEAGAHPEATMEQLRNLMTPLGGDGLGYGGLESYGLREHS